MTICSLPSILPYDIIMTSSHKLVSHQFQVSSSSLPTLEESVGLQGQSAGDVAIVLHGEVDLARG